MSNLNEDSGDFSSIINRPTKIERYKNFNTLNGLVKALENHHTVIDLRNESCVSGLIEYVDLNMNVDMKDVVFYDPRGTQHRFDNFYVTSRSIRYVHIPEGLSATKLMEELHAKMRRRYEPRERPQTYKKKRAEKYQESLVKENFPQPGPSNT